MSTQFTVEMQHSRETLTGLAHMQYDLFNFRNRVSRTLIAIAVVGMGVINMPAWWSYLLMAYGGYLLTARYNSANRVVSKTIGAIEASGLGYPRTRFEFEKTYFRAVALPDPQESDKPIRYADLAGLGEDSRYFYLFRDNFGGYVIAKEKLGKRTEEFRRLIETGSGKKFSYTAVPLRAMTAWLHNRRSRTGK